MEIQTVRNMCNMSALGFGRVLCFVGIVLKILTKFVVRYKIN